MKKLVALAVAVGTFALSGGIALADQPGAGDKQCIPGQQGNPHPAHMAGVCK